MSKSSLLFFKGAVLVLIHYLFFTFVQRYKLLRYSKERQHLDGLNNLHYNPLVSLSSLYKNVTVDLSPELAPITDY